MIKNPYIKFAVLCIGAALTVVREHDYYQAHGRVSDGIIGASITLGVTAAASLVYWAVNFPARRVKKLHDNR
jgi:hypothetical protein